MRITKILSYILGIFFLTMGENSSVKVLSINEFIRVSCEKDLAFAYILSDKLTLEYEGKLAVPVEKLILEATGGYGVSFTGEHYPNIDITLKKLMPRTASSYKVYGSSSYSGSIRSSSFGFTYNIDFIKNAFGRTYDIEERKAELNKKIALAQILQSYESYLSDLISYYYDWLKAYRTKISAEISHDEALKLLENVKKKKRWHIAYQIDVDKAELQAINKKKQMLAAKGAFKELTIRIAYSFGFPLDQEFLPDTLNSIYQSTKNAELMINESAFDSSRTGKIFISLKELNSLNVILAAEELLPTLTGYGNVEFTERDGDILENSTISTGVSLSFPFRKEHEKLDIERLKVEKQKLSMNAENVQEVQKLNLALIASDIENSKTNIEVIEQQLEFSEKIYKAELKDYESGRSSLNDLIQAQNSIHTNRLVKFNTQMEIAYKRLKILDVLDLLVKKVSDIKGEKSTLQVQTE